MGTRGSVGVIYQEQEKLGYNQFDSYPDGLGTNMLNFVSKINREDGWDEFKKSVAQLRNIEETEITDNQIIEKYKKYSNLSVSEQKLSDPYCLFREIQGSDWLDEVYNGNLQDFPFNNRFIKSSLFCDYAYIINLDTMKFEFYSGFQKIPQKGNKFGDTPNEDGYYPCRLVGVFNLLDIYDDITILEKMNKIIESEKDDTSVINYFRKPKLKAINESK